MEITPSAATLALEKYQRVRRERERESVCVCVPDVFSTVTILGWYYEVVL